MAGYEQAFRDAGAPLGNVLNHWSAIAPDESFIAITIWSHEFYDALLCSKEPVLGPTRPGAIKYFRITPGYIAEWTTKRLDAGRRHPKSDTGWNVLQRHLTEAKARNLPVRAVFIWPKGSADGSERAEVERADYKELWRLEVTYHDAKTGAYELAIFDARK